MTVFGLTRDNGNRVLFVVNVCERNMGVDIVGERLVTNLKFHADVNHYSRKWEEEQKTYSRGSITNGTEGDPTDMEREVDTIEQSNGGTERVTDDSHPSCTVLSNCGLDSRQNSRRGPRIRPSSKQLWK